MINISDETIHSCFMLKLLTNLVVLCDFLENWAAPNFHSGVVLKWSFSSVAYL
jgi:hypothetical protein